MQGSRSKINALVNVQLTYQGIDEMRQLDVANLNDYNIILGTPWIYQHQVCISLNPAHILIGSDNTLPIVADNNSRSLLNAVSPNFDVIAAREELMAYAEPLC